MKHPHRRDRFGHAAGLALVVGALVAHPSTGVAISLVQDTAQTKDTTKPPKFKDYDKVITKDAKTYRGLFSVHWVGDKLYFEVPRHELNKEQLLAARVVKGGGWFEGAGQRLIKWERRGDRLLIHEYLFGPIADSSSSIAKKVLDLRTGALLVSFPIETFGPDSAMVVDVTQLF